MQLLEFEETFRLIGQLFTHSSHSSHSSISRSMDSKLNLLAVESIVPIGQKRHQGLKTKTDDIMKIIVVAMIAMYRISL